MPQFQARFIYRALFITILFTSIVLACHIFFFLATNAIFLTNVTEMEQDEKKLFAKQFSSSHCSNAVVHRRFHIPHRSFFDSITTASSLSPSASTVRFFEFSNSIRNQVREASTPQARNVMIMTCMLKLVATISPIRTRISSTNTRYVKRRTPTLTPGSNIESTILCSILPVVKFSVEFYIYDNAKRYRR